MELQDDPELEISRPPRTRNPSQAEIEQLCEVIQRGWDRHTRRLRSGCYARRRVEVEVVEADQMFG